MHNGIKWVAVGFHTARSSLLLFKHCNTQPTINRYHDRYLYTSMAITIQSSSAANRKGEGRHRRKSFFRHNEVSQKITSASTNTVEDGDPAPKCIKYIPRKSAADALSFPDIHDDTEGVPAFASLANQFPSGASTLVDIGGGRFDQCTHWVLANTGIEMRVMDPFQRSAEHNRSVQDWIEFSGGVDIATSMSVLNVIPDLANRLEHICVLHSILKRGGVAFFKVWAGMWPLRGSGIAEMDTTNNTYQANCWASSFYEEVRAVFGAENVCVNNDRNCIVAMKPE